MATTHSINAAKANLSRLIERACAGEDVVIARGATPVVRLVPISRQPAGRSFGAMRGRAKVTAAFFGPLPNDKLDAWQA